MSTDVKVTLINLTWGQGRWGTSCWTFFALIFHPNQKFELLRQEMSQKLLQNRKRRPKNYLILSEKGDSSLTSASPSAEDPETFSSSEQWLVYQEQGTMHRTKGHPSVCKIIFNMTSILFKFLNKNAEVC